MLYNAGKDEHYLPESRYIVPAVGHDTATFLVFKSRLVLSLEMPISGIEVTQNAVDERVTHTILRVLTIADGSLAVTSLCSMSNSSNLGTLRGQQWCGFSTPILKPCMLWVTISIGRLITTPIKRNIIQ